LDISPLEASTRWKQVVQILTVAESANNVPFALSFTENTSLKSFIKPVFLALDVMIGF
jgi:hypothetical protein